MYGRVIWLARNDTPKIRKMRRTTGSPSTLRMAPNASRTTDPSGMTSGRTSFEPNHTSRAVPTERAAENQKTAGSDQPKPSIRMPARTGPTANPIGPDTPKIAMIVPIRRTGVTSRIPASITPVFPSWKPISSMLNASCHGSRDNATPANTTASTMQLRTMTALRLYLSAQTPQSGTNGMPTTKISALNRPMNASRSASGTPMSRRYVGTRAKI